MLTKKQHQLLSFIDQKLGRTGISPSYDEMRLALNLKSKSGIHRLITGLEERGFIRRLPHRARALEIKKLPENSTNLINQTSGVEQKNSLTPNVISGAFGDSFVSQSSVKPSDNSTNDPSTLSLPLYGRIAAGTPIEALLGHSAEIDVPAGLLASNREHYALEVDGDSMIEAGIHDGDTVIIQRANTADNGSVVVALVEGTEVTLKRLRRKGAAIALEPANKNYETRIFGPDQIQVQGLLVGLIRKY
ncbi:MAG: repressor LexA [Rhodospirillaceae bacterium TMED8]|nr:repressor LexA [Magnetovibrio sp.]OUT51656.1 MAG: repressor LexA [Rhodospirillaceae bacterium TMED8]